MTAATGVSREVQDYLAAVELELADLPADDRSALLEDLAQHLEALAAEDDDRPVVVRLGNPVAYAADLRAAAGLPARATGSLPAGAGLRKWLDRAAPAARRVAPAARRLAPAARATRRLLVELRPAWWVLRGYLLVLVPCLMRLDGVRDFPVPAPMGNSLLGLLLVVAAVAGSVALGRRQLPRVLDVAVALGGVVLVLVAFEVWDDASSDGMTRSYASSAWPAPAPEQAMGEYPLLSRSGPVTDVFPYAADGTPLENVLLYDQDGRPLRVGFQEWWADGCARVLDTPLAADGMPVPFSYPQSYELDRVLEPNAIGVDGSPMPVSSCDADVPRPEVPLPTYPATESTAPAPGD